jgi:hypothetical protein
VGRALFIVAQIWLPLTGLPTIYFTSKKHKLAPFFGLLGQPAHFYAAIYTRQWGLLALNTAYAFMWVVTAYRWWWPNQISKG